MSEARSLYDAVDEDGGSALSVWMDGGHLVFIKKNWQEVTQEEWSALGHVAGNLHYGDMIELRGVLWGDGFNLKLRKLPPEDESHIPVGDTWSMDISHGLIGIQTSMTSLNPFEVSSGDETDFHFIGGFSFKTSKGVSE